MSQDKETFNFILLYIASSVDYNTRSEDVILKINDKDVTDSKKRQTLKDGRGGTKNVVDQ